MLLRERRLKTEPLIPERTRARCSGEGISLIEDASEPWDTEASAFEVVVEKEAEGENPGPSIDDWRERGKELVLLNINMA